MQNEILIAIIVGGGAAVLALLALLVALMASIAARQAARAAEAVAQEVKQTAASHWMKDQELEAALKLRQRPHGVIQKMKDELEVVLRARAQAIDRDAAIQSVSAAGRAIQAMQSEIQSQLGQGEQIALLRARDVALEASARLRDALNGVSDVAQISEDDRRALRLLRADLTEAQLVFRDSTVSRLTKRVLDHSASA